MYIKEKNVEITLFMKHNNNTFHLYKQTTLNIGDLNIYCIWQKYLFYSVCINHPLEIKQVLYNDNWSEIYKIYCFVLMMLLCYTNDNWSGFKQVVYSDNWSGFKHSFSRKL